MPAVEPPTGVAVAAAPPARSGADASPPVVGPGYSAIACAGVAPLSTASVRAISTLVSLVSIASDDAEDALAASVDLGAGLLNSLRLQPAPDEGLMV